jgi:hypothetical protein
MTDDLQDQKTVHVRRPSPDVIESSTPASPVGVGYTA